MKTFQRVVETINNIAADVATIMLLVMFAINCIDIVASKVFNVPFPGVVELTGYLMAVLIPAAAGLVFLEGQHVRIEIVTAKLPQAVREWMDRIISLALCVLFSFLSWKMFTYGMDRQRSGEYSDTLQLPFYYVIYLVALAFIPFCLALIRGFLAPSKTDGVR